MANEQHLKWLKKGVAAWNARMEKAWFETDLSGADLSGANLFEADLSEADLSGADLSGANLRGANLFEADLSGAKLFEADLSGANLRGAKLFEADLTAADLRTLVYSARGTNDVSHAEYTDFSTAIGLDQDQLDSMSGDNGTIIPKDLARPDRWDTIELPPDHPNYEGPVEEPEHYDIFLSYSHQDQPRAKVLRDHLTSAGFNIWWDQEIGAGDRWRDAIAENLEDSQIVLTLWSDASVQSDAVREEAATAQSARKLVHARIDDVKLPYGFGETQYVNMIGWNGDAKDPNFLKLVQNLRDKLSPPNPTEIADRLVQTSPIAFQIDDGKLTPHDTPLNVDPRVKDTSDKVARLNALLLTTQALQEMIADRDAYQLPNELLHRVNGLVLALNHAEVIWYSLEDARDALSGCMARFDAKATWNDGVVSDLERIVIRITEIQPLLQPEQPRIDLEDGKPPETEPTISADKLKDIREMALDLMDALESDEGKSTLSEAAEDVLETNAGAILEEEQSAFDPDQKDRQLSKLRRAVKGMAYTVGGVIAAVGGGIAVNLLTAPEAAATLMMRLQPIMDRLLALFY